MARSPVDEVKWVCIRFRSGVRPVINSKASVAWNTAMSPPFGVTHPRGVAPRNLPSTVVDSGPGSRQIVEHLAPLEHRSLVYPLGSHQS